MTADFNSPQRQSKIGVLVMFFDTIRQFSRALWPLLLVWFFNRPALGGYYVFIGILIIFVLISVYAYLRFMKFTFWIDNANDEFIISEGVFNKTKTVIKLDRIQQVNITQSLLQRIINVYALEIDTAGSNKQEGNIKAVSNELALSLKQRLLQNERRQQAVEEIVPEEKAELPFMTIGISSLLKVGVTSNYLKSFWLIFIFTVTMYDNFVHISNSGIIDEDRIQTYVVKNAIINSASFLVMLILVLILAINLVRTIVRYYGYKITRQSGSLLMSFGLINTKSTIIKPEKVQTVTITQNFFQKKMNILNVRIRQAMSGNHDERGMPKENALEIPGCNERERDAILKLLLDTIPEKGAMLKPNFRKLGFSIFLTILLPLGVFFLVARWQPDLYEFDYLALVYAILVLTVLCFGFRNYRLFISDRFIIKQSGAWDISNEIVEPGKIQAITMSQLFWHKRVDIVYLTLHTAGGNISFQLGNYTKIKQYVNLWLYEMEASDSNWM
ncbi:MAG: hypothetical protein EOO48_02580 [Flavobacterium sp.]|nr:MAG: hypothetical protein EOO48_02580 [Flavobacterium sp.]